MLSRVSSPGPRVLPLRGRTFSRRAGQSLVETALMIILISLILLGVLQVSRLFVAKEIITHSAAAGARAAAVGFNEFMIHKVTRVAAIPNAGAIRNPSLPGIGAGDGLFNTTDVGELWGDHRRPGLVRTRTPYDPRRDAEMYRIPEYLAATDWSQLPGYLDYEDWETLAPPSVVVGADDDVSVGIRQDYPLRFPMVRAFYADEEVDLNTRARQANHAGLYLQ
jgi:hypothetical protein